MQGPGSAPQTRQFFDDGRVGVYVHLPFCERICPYCDFAVVAARNLEAKVEADYVAGVRRELEARRSAFEGRELASIYFGGGTPSLFEPESIRSLIEAIHAAFPSAGNAAASPGPNVETTLELNPSSLEQSRLPGFRDVGVDRLSIGIQSFDDRQLKRLGRAHRADVARSTLESARAAGFENLSIDLIFGGPDQSEDDLERDLAELIEWKPDHVSVYELTFEPATPFGRALAAGKMQACDDERAAGMTLQIESRLEAEGLERYEISSYAREGMRSRHNARYWKRQAVLGLGMGAHSMEARSVSSPHGARRANPRTLEAWTRALAEDAGEVGAEETLPPRTARGEAVFLALRQKEGLSARSFEAEFGAPPRAFFEAEIEEMIGRGYLVEGESPRKNGGDVSAGAGSDPADLRLSDEGRLMADSVALSFVSDE